MAFNNNVMIVRQKLLRSLIKLWNEDRLVEQIDRLPIEFSPRTARPNGRCCIHKERAVWKYKALPLMGFDMSDETDELTPLSEYANKAMQRRERVKENILCVIDEACSSCIQSQYHVTNLCKGCVARTCIVNCPKQAIKITKTGQAEIDHDLCISCGICHKSCPYHAIVHIPVPCEEACPVKAISKDDRGIEHIDESKCIYCAKCLNSCPFGAIFEISQVFDVLQAIRRGEKVIAMVAPAILGQYDAPLENIYGAIKAIGFTDVYEVAEGAMETIRIEGAEFLHKMHEGQPFMTTSCCPSYIEMARKHAPELQKYISDTGSPMYYTARIARKDYPEGRMVFIGPCVAKRKEAQRDEEVDFVMTYEELNCVLAGMGIDVHGAQPYPMKTSSIRDAHRFGTGGGVMTAVKNALGEEFTSKYTGLQIANLDKKTVGLLKAYGKSGKAPANFIEVMTCAGGCVTGPATFNSSDAGQRLFQKKIETIG